MSISFARRFWVYILMFVFVGAPASVHAFSLIVNEEGNGDVAVEQVVEDDVYAFGNAVDIAESVIGDVMAFGQNVSLTHSVSEDVYTAGQTIDVSGAIADDLHAAGESVTIAGEIVGDTFVAGETIRITKEAQVGRDLYAAGQSTTVAGSVGGTVRLAGEQMIVGESAVIGGDLKTFGPNKPEIAEGARILGEIVHEVGAYDAKEFKEPLLAQWVRRTLTLFALTLVLFYLLPTLTEQVISTVRTRKGASILTGLVWLALLLPVFVALLVTVIGIPMAFVVLLATIALYIVAAGYGAILVGSLVMQRLSAGKDSGAITWAHLLLGAVIYETVQLLGGIGILLTIIVVLFALGALLQSLWARLRS